MTQIILKGGFCGMETYTVLSSHVAAQLKDKGYEIVCPVINECLSGGFAYIFKVTPGFMNDL